MIILSGMGEMAEKRIIGRVDKIDLPELGLTDVPVKIDTGARTSALHALGVQPFVRDGKPFVSFFLQHLKHPSKKGQRLELPSLGTKRIKSSNGVVETRFIVETTVVLFGESFRARFSLTDRGEMEYPALLGRRLLSHKFIVDVTEVNCSYLFKYPERAKKKAQA